MSLTPHPYRRSVKGRQMPDWYWRVCADRALENRHYTETYWFGPGDPRSTCPYYLGKPGGTCNQGCWEEPSCFTDAWSENWPRYPLDLHRISKRVHRKPVCLMW